MYKEDFKMNLKSKNLISIVVLLLVQSIITVSSEYTEAKEFEFECDQVVFDPASLLAHNLIDLGDSRVKLLIKSDYYDPKEVRDPGSVQVISNRFCLINNYFSLLVL